MLYCCSSCSCSGDLLAQSFQTRSRWNLAGLFIRWIRLDWRSRILIWRHTFKMAAMTSFHAELVHEYNHVHTHRFPSSTR